MGQQLEDNNVDLLNAGASWEEFYTFAHDASAAIFELVNYDDLVNIYETELLPKLTQKADYLQNHVFSIMLLDHDDFVSFGTEMFVKEMMNAFPDMDTNQARVAAAINAAFPVFMADMGY